MNNSNFIQTDLETKKRTLTEVIHKRCKGFIKWEIIESIVERLDMHRQMKIDVVTEGVFIREVKAKTTIIIEDGNLENISMQLCRVLLGKLELGKEVVTIEDDEENVSIKQETQIINHPVIAQIEEQGLGELEPSSARIVIYL